MGYTLFTMVLLSSMIYYFESGQMDFATGRRMVDHAAYPNMMVHTPFQSIPDTFWWTLVTMSTVGYGDMVPVTPWGRALGVITMYTGLILLAMPIAIVGGNYTELYGIQAEKNRQEKKRKQRVTDIMSRYLMVRINLEEEEERLEEKLGKSIAQMRASAPVGPNNTPETKRRSQRLEGNINIVTMHRSFYIWKRFTEMEQEEDTVSMAKISAVINAAVTGSPDGQEGMAAEVKELKAVIAAQGAELSSLKNDLGTLEERRAKEAGDMKMQLEQLLSLVRDMSTNGN